MMTAIRPIDRIDMHEASNRPPALEKMSPLSRDRALAEVVMRQANPAADAFCRLHLGDRGSAYGAFDAATDTRATLDLAMPAS